MFIYHWEDRTEYDTVVLYGKERVESVLAFCGIHNIWGTYLRWDGRKRETNSRDLAAAMLEPKR